jgi:N-ethylmaleimide reductase
MKLLSPVSLGALSLKNRVVMAPLTRMRAGAEDVPGDLAAQYYAQRSSAGLIISEARKSLPRARDTLPRRVFTRMLRLQVGKR